MPIIGSIGAASAGGFGQRKGKGVIDLEYLVIAGGGAGGAAFNSFTAGGGGAGGHLSSPSLELFLGTPYTVTVGAGGTSEPSGATPLAPDSVLDTVTAKGGGRGGFASFNPLAGNGGSGGGQSDNNIGTGTPGQGNDGGSGNPNTGAGGGGGAGAVGGNGSGSPSTRAGGNGGAGAANSITGTPVTRAGGGGGADGGSGGSGGGGAGASFTSPSTGPQNYGLPGSANTGGGGGGGVGNGPGAGPNAGGQGGSGIIIVKYPDTFTISNPGGGLTISTPGAAGGFKVSSITAGTGNVEFS